MPYHQERKYFEFLKKNLQDDIKAEFENAVSTLIGRYNTSIRENRFTVGGAIEIFTLGLLRSAEIDALPYSSQEDAGDILLPNHIILSIKSSFRKPHSIRLMNKQGTGSRDWSTATLFILSGIGILYGDPDMIHECEINDAGDSIMLRSRAIRRIAKDSSNIIAMKIPEKPDKAAAGSSLMASNAIARQVLIDEELGELFESVKSFLLNR
ncbi:MAG: hypothetical protein OXG09_11240 [Chloroflexi bacterium]|nr:hypothetical protein [Chloroflexota bacterium]